MTESRDWLEKIGKAEGSKLKAENRIGTRDTIKGTKPVRTFFQVSGLIPPIK